MRAYFLTAILLLVGASPGAAQDDEAILDFGNDSFRAGGSVVFDTAGRDDLFMAGETVRSTADISGSAHLAGRRVTMTGAVGGDAIAAGMDVALEGPVSGDATVAGYDLRVDAVGGDLRISGSKLAIEGPVSGYAMIAGETVRLNATIAGDVSLVAQTVEFGEGARIDGRLTLYEDDPGALEVPASVIPDDRIDRREVSDWQGARRDMKVWNWQRAIGSFLMGVLLVSALGALIAAIIPQTLAEMRRGLLDRPFRNLWIGFLTQSALVGAAVLFAMTVIGIALSPAAVTIALLAAFAGYVVAVYAFGVGLLLAIGKPEPESIGRRALAAGLGALVAGLIALIPLLGWLFVLSLVLAGVGAIVQRTLRPGFFLPAS